MGDRHRRALKPIARIRSEARIKYAIERFRWRTPLIKYTRDSAKTARSPPGYPSLRIPGHMVCTVAHPR